ncbi:4-hydroxythreonine-4-phosphate dehydrogenase PdxA [Pseudobacteroides cellulosolvens]|uniref:4-hydroxythreonine-4-phosphate dehydrogenase n=1 Tax=Pseudobacteroides cellulosolvens ATCC 35603 = DSM 2933 TaxID=398512 RepID=A0A0L6JRI8_9FIRM|nr:4-hydroxythreonine-4-phosphate dehydrogenase PdxA [Pseudobacteroides cellulosolvens]KNY28456.1 4-hydroxythreonine-4-phosphate dehydrogenase [Pseudobacteroides cellulosolvens ATCC 35603 = DSM 2933]
MNRPVIGITMGDPAGIGPEIVLKAMKNSELYCICKPLVIGNAEILNRADAIVKSGLNINVVTDAEKGSYCCGTVDVIDIEGVNISGIKFGQVSSDAGWAAYKTIEKSVELAKEGHITAIATAPINKEAIKKANIDFIGHTEMLAGLTATNDPLTMFQVGNLRVFFLSRHVSLKKACDLVTKDRIINYVMRLYNALKVLGVDRKKIAIAGLNPHSGEHGLFGDEEVREIEPAVEYLRDKRIDVEGPIAADSVYYLALKGKYDAVLSLYHDQGHIATKMVDFERTISLTIGLPFLRTSVDHGTAFDIAGKGLASSVSMEEAIRLAVIYGKKYSA